MEITGYRTLSEEDIILMNRVKAVAGDVGALLESLRGLDLDQRWLSIGAADLQKGFMAVNRAIAKPTTFG